MEKLSRTGKRLESTSRSLLVSMYSLEFEKNTTPSAKLKKHPSP